VSGTVVAVPALVGVVYGLGNAAVHGWQAAGILRPLLARIGIVFVLIERRVPGPLLPLPVVLHRSRAAAYLSVGISGIGSFAVFLFLTYYLQQTPKFTPFQTGAALLPMIGMLIVGAVISGSALLPRTGPRPLLPAGCLLAGLAMAMLTRIGPYSSYAATFLPALLLFGLGFGPIFDPAQNVATSGVQSPDSGVASAMVNTAQQVGGGVGVSLFSSLNATATTNYLAAHAATATTAATRVAATLHGDHFVFWIAAALLLAGVVLAALLFRSGPFTGHHGYSARHRAPRTTNPSSAGAASVQSLRDPDQNLTMHSASR